MILNLTQHNATQDQIVQGVQAQPLLGVPELITFDDIPSQDEMIQRAAKVAMLASEQGADQAMIGGAPFFMSCLECELKTLGIKPVYAFSRRESVELKKEDGTVQKTNVFKHLGFVEV